MKIAATGDLTGRAIPEWIGRNADSTVPDRVRVRLALRFEGRDALTSARLQKGWHLDHTTALKDWIKTDAAPHGNRESNLQPVNAVVNTKKAAQENKARAKVTSLQKMRFNIAAPKAKIQSAGFGTRLKSPDKFSRIAASHQSHLEKMQRKVLT